MVKSFDHKTILAHGKKAVSAQAETVNNLLKSIDDSFAKAVEAILNCPGKVIVTGIGKSGNIAQKIASTLTSTGTTSVFMHPADGIHGDLGMIQRGDILLALSKMGESAEVLGVLPAAKKIGAKIIAVTASRESALARAADVVLFTPVEREACPLNLAPTSSTTAALVIGDALAVTVMELKGFTSEDFAVFHPGGKLGRRLTLKVRDVMVPVKRCPVMEPSLCKMEEVLSALSRFALGVVLLSEDGRKLDGIITDGEVRRLVETLGPKFFSVKPIDVMNRMPISIRDDVLAMEALETMERREKPLNFLVVQDELGHIAGVVQLHNIVDLR